MPTIMACHIMMVSMTRILNGHLHQQQHVPTLGTYTAL